MATISTIFR